MLVAAVILAIGMAGAQSALLSAARVRSAAAAREELAALAVERMVWMERRGCAARDTAATDVGPRSTEVAWRVAPDSGGLRLSLEASVPLPAGPHALALSAAFPCR